MSKAPYTNRPLTEEEKAFAEEHHDMMYRYMRLHRLDIEEWYDILIIPYLQAVKKYHEYEHLRKYKFEQIFFRTLDNARSNYFRDMNREKRHPEGGVFSYNALFENEHSTSSNTYEWFLIDVYTNVEKQVITKELYREFYRRCTEKKFEEQSDILQETLELLLDGYTYKQISLKVYGKRKNDWLVEMDVERFRRIFKSVFGF